MTALINAMRVLTDPAQTGAVAVSMPQDVQGEAWDFPEYFFRKRVHRITRPVAVDEEIADAVALFRKAKRPLVIVGGGVRYSEAGKEVEAFCEKFAVPMCETQAGKSAVLSGHPLNLGGVGATGNLAANSIAAKADLVLGVGTRFSDFTTSSKWQYGNPKVRIATINASAFHAEKMDAVRMVGDARATVLKLSSELEKINYRSAYKNEIARAKAAWDKEMIRLSSLRYAKSFTPEVASRDPRTVDEFVRVTGGDICQTAAVAAVRRIIPADAIVVGASGSLPGDLQRMWTTEVRDSYHMEYGYSCMGYEIAAALGAKIACPGREVYALVGDGSYLMLHSEMITALQENLKITVLVFDNAGFGCINNLQMEQGVGSLATEFRMRNPKSGKLDGGLMRIDFAQAAAGYGFTTYTAKTMAEFEAALTDALLQKNSVLIDAKVLPKSMTHGYASWWHVGCAEVTRSKKGEAAYKDKVAHLKNARKY